jgi:hypothetical protein
VKFEAGELAVLTGAFLIVEREAPKIEDATDREKARQLLLYLKGFINAGPDEREARDDGA